MGLYRVRFDLTEIYEDGFTASRGKVWCIEAESDKAAIIICMKQAMRRWGAVFSGICQLDFREAHHINRLSNFTAEFVRGL